ncbi:hypothetical protein PF003_g24299 [Phytophthora fragariae]|nr:hypothetical protein PF003_g24299 [Phytophthora fragariae]
MHAVLNSLVSALCSGSAVTLNTFSLGLTSQVRYNCLHSRANKFTYRSIIAISTAS